MPRTLQGATGTWELVIGMEVHAQVSSKAKLFSGAATAFGAEPNTQVSLIDAAMPGMLPVINGACVEQAVRTGLGLKAQINLRSVFDRKNYFYPDLPPGYQISQFTRPVVGKGEVAIEVDGEERRIGITRLHLEQDAGKSVHDLVPDGTCVDLNRAGVALMEIVSEPDIRSPEEAGAYLTKLRAILRYLGTCDGNMEEGSMRADVNVSVRRPGEGYGTRCEIKNVNSIRFVQQAILYEARRQIDVIEGGGKVVQETRLFDANRGETRSMRSKEEAHDYRYFPDPDLLPLELDPAWVEKIKSGLPELPDDKARRFQSEFGLNRETAGVLVAERDNALFFEVALGKVRETTDLPIQRWTAEFAGLFFDFRGRLERMNVDIARSPVSEPQLAELFSLKLKGVISGPILKTVLDEMLLNQKSALQIIDEKGLKQITDTGAIEAAVDQAIAQGAKQVEQYRAGNEKILGWFVGQVMKATGGKANPAAVNEILRKKLSG